MNDNYRNDTYMNATLHNEDFSSGIGLLKSHTLLQYNYSSKLNDMNMSVDNGDINGYYFYMNISYGSKSKNHNSIDYTKKSDKISTNIF